MVTMCPTALVGCAGYPAREALAQRVLFRLTARRGSFPFWPELGSRLYQLGSLPTSQRSAAAVQYVTEALAQEPVDVEEVILTPQPGGTAELQVRLSCRTRAGCNAGGAGVREDKNHEDCGRNL